MQNIHEAIRKAVEEPKLTEMLDPNFHPSPTKLVRFADGDVVPKNRQERRKRHIYNKRPR